MKNRNIRLGFTMLLIVVIFQTLLFSGCSKTNSSTSPKFKDGDIVCLVIDPPTHGMVVKSGWKHNGHWIYEVRFRADSLRTRTHLLNPDETITSHVSETDYFREFELKGLENS